MTALHVVEQRLLARDAYTIWTDSMKGVSDISISNPKVDVTAQTEEKAEVTAEYDIKIEPTQPSVKTKFRLEKENGEWLIAGLSGFKPGGLLGWTEVSVFVGDGRGGPVGGVEVVCHTNEGEVSGTTDDKGMVIFENP